MEQPLLEPVGEHLDDDRFCVAAITDGGSDSDMPLSSVAHWTM